MIDVVWLVTIRFKILRRLLWNMRMPNPKLLGLVSLHNPSDFRSSSVSLYPDNHLISFKEKLRLWSLSFPFHELFILQFFALSECFLEVVCMYVPMWVWHKACLKCLSCLWHKACASQVYLSVVVCRIIPNFLKVSSRNP